MEMRAGAALVVGVLGVQTGTLPVVAQEARTVFRMEALADGVHAAIVVPQPDAYAFANSLVVVGERGVLVVDTQQSPRAARSLVREIESMTDLPVRWVVNTHWHGDHVHGNVAYRARWPGVEFIATRATVDGIRGPGQRMRMEELASLPESIREREQWLAAGRIPNGPTLDPELHAQVEYSLRMRRLYLDELRALEVVYPGTLVEARTVLDLGGRTATLIPLGWAHTEGDLAVFLEDEGILAVGDVVEEGLPWLEGANLAGWASALETLQGLKAVAVLPSHAGGADGTRLLDGVAALFRDLVGGATAAAGDDPVAYVVGRLASHRAFLGELGISDEAFDRWALAAAEMAVAEAPIAGLGRDGQYRSPW